MAIAKLKAQDGAAVLVNTDHVILVGPAATKGNNGTGIQPLIGQTVMMLMGTAPIVLAMTLEEVHTALLAGIRRSEPSHLALVEKT